MPSMTLKTPFYAWLFLVFLVTNIVHECAHWLVGAAFGQEMVFTLNAIRISSTMVPWQKALMDIAGPLVTICQAVIAYVIVMRSGSHKAFAFLYAAMFMRLVAGIVTVVNPNDEARVSMFLDLGMWTLPVLVPAGLIALVVIAHRRLQLGWKDQLLCYLAGSVAVSLIVGIDRVLF